MSKENIVVRYEAEDGPYFESNSTPPDPDFWSLKSLEGAIPISHNCQVTRHTQRKQGHRIYHATKQRPSGENRLTGVTVVDEKVTYSELQDHPAVTSEWFERYTASVLHETHLPDDLNKAKKNGEDPVTAHRRLTKVILGDPVHSFWVGGNGPTLQEALAYADIQRDTSCRRIKDLNRDEGDRLYEVLSFFEPIDGYPGTIGSLHEIGCGSGIISNKRIKSDGC